MLFDYVNGKCQMRNPKTKIAFDILAAFGFILYLAAFFIFVNPTFASPPVFDSDVYRTQGKRLKEAIAANDTKEVIKMLNKGIAPHKLTAAKYLGEFGDRSALKTLNNINLRGGGSERNFKKYPGFSHTPSAEYAIAIYKILTRDNSESEQIEALFELLEGRGPAVPKQVSQKSAKTNYTIGKRVAQELGKFNRTAVLKRLRKSENLGAATVAVWLEVGNMVTEQAISRCMEIARNEIPAQRYGAIENLGKLIPKSISALDELAIEGFVDAVKVLGMDDNNELPEVFDMLCWHLLKNDYAQVRISASGAIGRVKRQDFRPKSIQNLIYGMYDRSTYVQSKAADALYHAASEKNKPYFEPFKKSLISAYNNHPNPVVRDRLRNAFRKLKYPPPVSPTQPFKSKLLQDCLGDEYSRYKAYVASLPDKKQKPPAEYLSIELSLLPMFREKYYTIGEFPFNRINPGIRKYLLYYLENVNSNRMICGKAIMLLGYVGKAEDIKFLDDYIHKFLTQATKKTPLSRHSWSRWRYSIAYGSGQFSGIIIRRKVKGAESFFKRYAQLSAWITPEDKPTPFFWPYTRFLVEACRYSLEDYTIKAVRAVAPDGGGPGKHSFWSVTGGESDVYTLTMRPCKASITDLKKKLNNDYEKCKVEIDSLIKKGDAMVSPKSSVNN